MMKLVCAIYDTQAKVYASPFYMNTKGEAVRAFSDAVNDAQMGSLNKHPQDFLLFCIGEWDDNTGKLVSYSPPERLALGSDFVRKEVLTK